MSETATQIFSIDTRLPSSPVTAEGPFSSSDFICDSSLHVGETVEHTTSWLTINPVVGCPLACAYCFREHWAAPDLPRKIVEPERAVTELINHPEFVRGETPIAINVSSTDALLPSVKDVTFECLQRLDFAGLTNVVGLITKCGVSDGDISLFRSLRCLRLIVFVSYAEMPTLVEPVSVGPRLEALRKLKEAGIPSVVYFRPIVAGWNDTEEKMERVLRVADDYAGSVVYGGLHMSPKISAALALRGIVIPPAENRSFHEKPLEYEVEARLIATAGRLSIRVPLYKHTSCAVSHAFFIRNYNQLYLHPIRNCSASCPLAQQARCTGGRAL